jgi:Holliday junction resolvasome RuvABC ATP-dependent DNA helicase subunit
MARRPQDFHGFYGQRRRVEFLRQQIKGALELGKPAPHLLLVGPSGVGKTTLARALAKDYGTDFHEVLGKNATPDLLCELAVGLAAKDFVFVDEAHRLRGDAQEFFYTWIDSGYVADRLEAGAEAERDKAGHLLVKPFTLILATDQEGELLDALHKRVWHVIPFDDYTEQELVEIGRAVASGLGLTLTPQAMRKVASVCQGLPRRLEHILKGAQLHYHADLGRDLAERDVQQYLRAAGTSDDGIDGRQQQYLRLLHDEGAVGLDTMASLLKSDRESVRARVEAPLVWARLVRVTQAGRVLTPKGTRWVQAHPETDANQDAEEGRDDGDGRDGG